MRFKPVYHIVIGSNEIDMTSDPSASTAVRLTLSRDMDAHCDRCELRLAPLGGIQPVKDQDMTLDLGYDSSLTRVFTGKISEVIPEVTAVRIVGLSSLHALDGVFSNRTYENQSAGDIVRDLAGQAGLHTGTIEDGIRWIVYVIDGRISAARHVFRMAERCGFDTYVLPTGELEFRAFTKASSDQVFTYGQDLLSYSVDIRPEWVSDVSVYGDSPASSRNDQAADWLTKNFQPGQASGGQGSQSILIQDPAIRTTDGANIRAQGALRRLRQRAIAGTLKALGRPELKLGDAIGIEKVPDERVNGVYQVRAVRHRLDRQAGMVTEVDFWSIP